MLSILNLFFELRVEQIDIHGPLSVSFLYLETDSLDWTLRVRDKDRALTFSITCSLILFIAYLH